MAAVVRAAVDQIDVLNTNFRLEHKDSSNNMVHKMQKQRSHFQHEGGNL